MAWSTPPVFVSGNVLTAAQMNVLTADLNESELVRLTPLEAEFLTTPYAVATGANVLTARQAASDFIAFVSETTTATSLGDLTSGTVGPRVELITGTSALVFMNATVQNSNNTTASSISYDVTGATTIAATQIYISLLTAAANQQATMAGVRLETGLNAGDNIFTMKYVVGAGTGTFSRRYFTVMSF